MDSMAEQKQRTWKRERQQKKGSKASFCSAEAASLLAFALGFWVGSNTMLACGSTLRLSALVTSTHAHTGYYSLRYKKVAQAYFVSIERDCCEQRTIALVHVHTCPYRHTNE